MIASVSEIAKRYPELGALVASLPLVSVLGMLWLSQEPPQTTNVAAHAEANLWFVLPSLPIFLVIPALLRHGIGFHLSLALGCVLTVLLYLAKTWAGPRFGLKL